MYKIKVYIKSEEKAYEFPDQLAVKGHTCYGWKKETAAKLHENHERAKKMAEELAKEVGLEVEICDLANSFSRRMLALLRGKKTQAIVIGNKRVNGIPSEKKLLSPLNEEEILAI